MDAAEVMDIAEAAARLGRSERWVRQLCGSGRLLAAKVGGRWLIARAVFEAERSAAA
jgi:excisionase family DNA binding protein